MTAPPGPDPEELARVQGELSDIHEAARARAEGRGEPLPAPLPTRTPEKPLSDPAPEPIPPSAPPDLAPVNATWRAEPHGPAPAGLFGVLSRLVRRLIGPELDAQRTFNSRQVQLDNALFAYLDARLAATHAHYDAVLGIHGRHMGEIDERHLILQEELVAHVHDLVQRIDLVLAQAERGRLSLEAALRDLRERLAAIEQRLTLG